MTGQNELVAKQSEDGEIVVRSPFGDEFVAARDVMTLIDAVRERLDERQAQRDALGDDLAQASIDAVKELRNAVESDDKTLIAYSKEMREALLEMSGFKAFEVQTRGAGARIDPRSVRGKFAAMLKECNAVLEAAKPKAPTHTYIIKATCTDAALNEIAKAATKHGVTDFTWATAQSDAAVEQIANWLIENQGVIFRS